MEHVCTVSGTRPAAVSLRATLRPPRLRGALIASAASLRRRRGTRERVSAAASTRSAIPGDNGTALRRPEAAGRRRFAHEGDRDGR